MSVFNVPADYQQTLNGSLDTSSVIRLPFAAPQIWWKNGDPALEFQEAIVSAQRFGGWGCDQEEIAEHGVSYAAQAGWQLFSMRSGQGGGTYQAYLTRQLWAAPILRRFAWFKGRNPGERDTSKTQYLVYLAKVNPADKTFTPMGPAILHASALTGLDLDACFKEFKSKTAEVRIDEGKPVPPNYFYHPIGTWGTKPIYKERKSKQNGQGSLVTPPALFNPPNGFALETLQRWFVGADVIKEIVRLYDLAGEWAADWNNRKDTRATDQLAARPGDVPLEPDVPPAHDEDAFPY
jgi:hypothetical protein